MGMMRLFSDGPSTRDISLPNPNPHRFTIERIEQFEAYSVCLVHYPDCTTFGGRKVLIYGVSPDVLRARTELDPHFLEGALSPLARFPATDQGWRDACAFALMKRLGDQRTETPENAGRR